jgi:hypothetical protein
MKKFFAIPLLIPAVFMPVFVAFADTHEEEVDLGGLIQTVYMWGIRLVIILALMGLIFGGYQYMTAGGNASAAGNAKSTIIAALSGLLLALSSFVLLNIFSPQFTSNLGPDFKALKTPGNQIPTDDRLGLYADCDPARTDQCVGELVCKTYLINRRDMKSTCEYASPTCSAVGGSCGGATECCSGGKYFNCSFDILGYTCTPKFPSL